MVFQQVVHCYKIHLFKKLTEDPFVEVLKTNQSDCRTRCSHGNMPRSRMGMGTRLLELYTYVETFGGLVCCYHGEDEEVLLRCEERQERRGVQLLVSMQLS